MTWLFVKGRKPYQRNHKHVIFQYSDIIWHWNLDLECEVQPILLVHAYESLDVHIKRANIYLLADSALFIASAPPSFPSLAVRKSGRGPGIIYHVSDVGVERRVERT